MTTANKITNIDMVARAKGLLLSQFKDKTNINKIVEALIEQVQELDNALLDLQEVRRLDNAYGIYLDNIGEKLKVQRTTLDDDDYRTAIKVRMLKNKSVGTLADVQEIIELLTFGFPVYIENTHPYVIELSCYLGCLNTPEGLELIKDLFPVNVAVRVQNVTTKPFGFAGNPNAAGFGDANNHGGQLASLIKSSYGITNDSRFKVVGKPIVVEPTVPVSSIPVLVSPPDVTPLTGIIENTIVMCSQGIWTSLTGIDYTYQWFTTEGPIVGAEDAQFEITVNQLGKSIFCRVTATNMNGSVTTDSNIVAVEDSNPVATGVLPNLGLDADYYDQTILEDTCAISISFNTNGQFVISGTSRPTTTHPFLETVAANAATGYEIQYYNTDGQPFSSPLANVWLPLTSPQTFTMSVNIRARDRGGNQVFTLRKVSDQSTTQGITYVSVSCDSNL